MPNDSYSIINQDFLIFDPEKANFVYCAKLQDGSQLTLKDENLNKLRSTTDLNWNLLPSGLTVTSSV